MNDSRRSQVRFARPHGLLGTAALLLVGGATPAAVAATDTIPACTAASCPTDYMQLEVNNIQYAPGLFKLQARVSQAKIPVGDAVFDRIVVNLIRPGAAQNRVACTESLPGVRVRNSVLNLDIGRQMTSCKLDEVVAQEQNLAFEICINSPDNCLKPISLASTPYAIKASYSVLAQKAHSANESVQAHYAHRITADTELFVGERTLEDGYLDFVTPDGNGTSGTSGWERLSDALRADMKSVYGADPDTLHPSPVGGYIQWTPVSSVENLGDGSQRALGTLHLVAKDDATAEKILKPLARLMIHAEQTFATGELHVISDDAAEYSLRSTAAGTSIVAGESTAELTTTGLSVLRGTETINLDATGVFLRSGSSSVGVSSSEATVSGPAASLTGAQSATATGGSATLELGVVSDTAKLSSSGSAASVSVAGAVATVSGNTSTTVSGGGASLVLDGNGLTCEANAQFGNPDTDATATLNIYSNTKFHGTVDIPSQVLGISLPGDSVAGPQITNGSIKSADIDSSEVQKRVSGSCEHGISQIEENGTPTCRSGTLSSLDVEDNFNATIRAADLKLGHSSRRGSPGRALVDGSTVLHLNYDGDWDGTVIGGSEVSVSGNASVHGRSTFWGGGDVRMDSEGSVVGGSVVVAVDSEQDGPMRLRMDPNEIDSSDTLMINQAGKKAVSIYGEVRMSGGSDVRTLGDDSIVGGAMVIAQGSGEEAVRIDENEIDTATDFMFNRESKKAVSIYGEVRMSGGSDVRTLGDGSIVGGAMVIAQDSGEEAVRIDENEIDTATDFMFNRESKKAVRFYGPVNMDAGALSDGSVTGADIKKSEVQARVNGSCDTGIKQINSEGGVTCRSVTTSGCYWEYSILGTVTCDDGDIIAGVDFDHKRVKCCKIN